MLVSGSLSISFVATSVSATAISDNLTKSEIRLSCSHVFNIVQRTRLDLSTFKNTKVKSFAQLPA